MSILGARRGTAYRGSRLAVFGCVVALLLSGCGPKAALYHRTGAIVGGPRKFTLPIPVGLNPQDLVLGAYQVVSLNDGAKLVDGRTTTPGDMAALGQHLPSGAMGGAGVKSSFRYIWSGAPLFFRGSTFTSFRTSRTEGDQQNTTITERAEDRQQVPIRQDPIWNVLLPVSNSTTPVTVNSDTMPMPLAPGEYGAVTVQPGATLNLTGSGDYMFASLDVESNAHVTFASVPPPHVFVNSSLILHGPIGAPGFVLAQNSFDSSVSYISIEAPFTGDLFIAPGANLSIKASSTGHFFALNVGVFENYTVTAPALSASSRAFLFPKAQITSQLGQFDPSTRMAEISSTVLVGGCGTKGDTAFINFNGQQLAFRPLFNPAGTLANIQLLPAPLGPTTPCLGSSLDPERVAENVSPQAFAWPIQPNGRAFYVMDPIAHIFLDHVVTRVNDSTVVSMGATERECEDQATGVPLAAGCPPMPQPGLACTGPNASCVYGPTPGTQCSCLGRFACGAQTGAPEGPSCPGIEPGRGSPCNGSAITGACIYPSGNECSCDNSNRTFVCGPLRRIEEDAFNVSVSTTCGTSWTSTPIDFFDLKVPDGASGSFAKDPDRWEMYFDPFDKKLYFSGFTANNFNESKTPTIFRADAQLVASASSLHIGLFDQEAVGAASPLVMTTTLDEAATLVNGATGRFVHFVTLRCVGSTPELVVYPPSGKKHEFPLADDSTPPSTHCASVVLGGTLKPNSWMGPSIVGTASWPPRIYAAYTGQSVNGTEIINVVEVTLRSSNQYADPPIIRYLTAVDFSSTNQHAMFPQLIRVDNAGGSDLTVDTPVVLRYALWDGSTNMEEHARMLYSGMQDVVQQGPQQQDIKLATWSVPVACGSDGCFPGDYRYGAFYRKANNTALSFFTPWTGQSTIGGSGVFAQGAIITVTPQSP